MVVAMKVDYRRYKHPGVVFSVLGLTTLMLISVFFLDRAHNTHRWIHFSGFSFQPSEVAKVGVILFLAFFLESRINSMNDWRNTLLPAILPTLMFLGLIVFQPDLGTAIACAAITTCMLFVAGLDLRWLGYGALASLLPLYFLIFHVAYRRDRILAFINPYSDPQGKGFHIIQSLIAVSTGGVTGLGFMEGKQKLFYLPEPHTDFIYAVTAEELGLIGAVLIATLFFVFAWRGLRTALRARDNFGRYIAIGVTSMIVVQAFFNISVVLELLPTKGIGKGTGLGLSMVHGLAEQSGGKLHIKSQKNRGTTVELILPAGEAADIPVSEPAPSPAAEPAPAGRHTVLIVDDDDLVLESTAAVVEDLGYTVLKAESGPAALHLLATRPDIDVVVSDQAMPGMTGVQLAKATMALRPTLPIILASGYAELTVPIDGMLRLSKPFRRATIADAITTAIASSHSNHNSAD